MRSFSTPRRSRRWLFGATAAVGALTILGVAGVAELRATPSPASTESSTPAAVGKNREADGRHPPLPTATSTAIAPADPAAHEVERLRAMPAVAAGRSAETIAGEATLQPDLYAAEFVRRLLTQDYRTSRERQLRWVQSESALTREPLVVGLIPAELRYRYALFSVTDATDAPSPIPTNTEWEGLGLQYGYTSVTIERVEEPLAWTNAVASGRITDPGITGREVTATVTRHTSIDGHPHTTNLSVAVSLNLEGPPTRPTWGFVAVIDYTAIQVS